MLQPKVNHRHLEALLLPWPSKEPMNECMSVTDWEVVPAPSPPCQEDQLLSPQKYQPGSVPGWLKETQYIILYYKNRRPHIILCPDLNSVESFSPLRSVLPFQWLSTQFSGGNGIHLCYNVTSLHLQNFLVSPRWSFRSVTAVVLNLPNWDPFIHTVHIVVTPAVTLFLLLLDNRNFATVTNYNTNIWHAGCMIGNPWGRAVEPLKGVVTHRLWTAALNDFSRLSSQQLPGRHLTIFKQKHFEVGLVFYLLSMFFE